MNKLHSKFYILILHLILLPLFGSDTKPDFCTGKISYANLSPGSRLSSLNLDPVPSLIYYINGKNEALGRPLELKSCILDNIHGKQELLLKYGDLAANVEGLSSCDAEKILLVPKKDEIFGLKFIAYDASKYNPNTPKKNIRLQILLRSLYFKKLIPKEMFLYYQVIESMEKGFGHLARYILNIVTSGPLTSIRPERIIELEKLLHESFENKENFNKTEESQGFEFYFKILADFSTKENRDIQDRAWSYFMDLLESEQNIEKVINRLMEKLNFEDSSVVALHINYTVIKILSVLPQEYKTLALSAKISELAFYKGQHYRKRISDALKTYFDSFPDELLYEENQETSDHHHTQTIPLSPFNDNPIISASQSHPLLSQLGEIKLSVLTQLGDKNSKDLLINSNIRLVAWVANKYFSNSNFLMSTLISEGMLGLIRSVELFHPEKGIRFVTYGQFYIRQKIGRFTQDNRGDIRIPVYKMEELNAFFASCRKKGIDLSTDKISPDEIARKLNMPVKKVKALLKYNFLFLSLDDKLKDSNTTLYDFLSDDEERFSKKFASTSWMETVMKAILKGFHQKWKKPEDIYRAKMIFKVRLLGDVNAMKELGIKDDTLEALGSAFNISRERIRQIETFTIIPIIRKILLYDNFLIGTEYESYARKPFLTPKNKLKKSA